MTPTDLKKLEKRRTQLQAIVSAQLTMKKDKRDQALIDSTYARIRKIDEWLGVKKSPKVNQKKKKAIGKKEFRKEWKESLGVAEPNEVMRIDTIDELKAAWPKIRGRNIQIEAQCEVLLEARKMNREDIINKKKK